MRSILKAITVVIMRIARRTLGCRMKPMAEGKETP